MALVLIIGVVVPVAVIFGNPSRKKDSSSKTNNDAPSNYNFLQDLNSLLISDKQSIHLVSFLSIEDSFEYLKMTDRR